MNETANTPAEFLLEARGVSVVFGGRVALDRVDLTVGRNEIVTVIGPNGAGKTTLIRMALGLLVPDAGTVRRRPGLRVGYMPQHLHIDDTLPLTVQRFLTLGRPAPGLTPREALAEVGVDYAIESPFQALSGGEARRVLLARALLGAPELLVLDEPSAGIDMAGQGELYDLLKDIRENRECSILLVSHDLHLVMAATDQVVCLNHHICCAGRPDAVAQHPEYLALFGTQLRDALAVYTHEHDHHHDLSGEPVDDPHDAAGAGHGHG